ncbi:MAG: hypothetical protein AUJ98_04370 [Bacteroidetes bacterium CG2_30_33_31]|nr:MAG: hypothetical protein AUJ98_04370 [Bacteroidetes bacterium CG2_30_33_31]
MNDNESPRRIFLKKLGLTMGAVAATPFLSTANIVEKRIKYPLTEKQKAFMEKHDIWMEEFIEVIKERRENPDSVDANLRLMKLTEQSEAWQTEVVEYMKDENFARHYMIATEKMTNEIN